MDFVEICNVCTRKVIITAAKRIFNSAKISRSYCDFYFGVTFFGTHCSFSYSEFLYVILFEFIFSCYLSLVVSAISFLKRLIFAYCVSYMRMSYTVSCHTDGLSLHYKKEEASEN